MEYYSIGLLSLIYILISSDGEISDSELNYLSKIKELEGVPEDIFEHFRRTILGRKEQEIYQIGINSINACSDAEKLQAFVRMYQMSLADGIIHVKEVRLLLYAVKLTNVDINEVISRAKAEAALTI